MQYFIFNLIETKIILKLFLDRKLSRNAGTTAIFEAQNKNMK
jgi:hypothetical protein